MENLTGKIKSDKKNSAENWKATASIEEKALFSFAYFFFCIFGVGIARVKGEFKYGEHIKEWCMRLQYSNKTSTVSAREHIKSTIALGKLAWHLYRLPVENRYNEWLYMAYVQDLAEHQLVDLNRYLGELPEYFGAYEKLTNAESILHYKHGRHEFMCRPVGIMSFKRGLHPYGLICDDILRDPEIKLDISQLLKITKIFREQIISMPTNELHVLGTPQDSSDLFAELERTQGWDAKRYPAWVDRARGIALWPQIWPAERLRQREAEIRTKAFNKEFMCRPVRSEEGYFMEDELEEVTHYKLKNYGKKREVKIDKFCYGGLDIGKKRHPSHLSIFAENRKNKLVQIISVWMDGWDYTRQLRLCKEFIQKLNMQCLFYDDTRAEMEGFKERGELPPEMKGLSFTQKLKFDLAAQLEKIVKAKDVLFINDERQKRQMLNVDNDLKSMETEEGHGDSFWSNALAIYAAKKSIANIRFV